MRRPDSIGAGQPDQLKQLGYPGRDRPPVPTQCCRQAKGDVA